MPYDVMRLIVSGVAVGRGCAEVLVPDADEEAVDRPGDALLVDCGEPDDRPMPRNPMPAKITAMITSSTTRASASRLLRWSGSKWPPRPGTGGSSSVNDGS